MNDNIKGIFLKGMIYAYALVEENEISDKNKDEVYIKYTRQITKYLRKVKPTGLPDSDLTLLRSLQECVKSLDANYFEDKHFSPFIVAILLLDYLIRERKDLTMRNRFGHIDTALAITEIETTFTKNDIAKNHQVYVNKMLKLIGE